MMKILLLVIDMQNDFCSSRGALYVTGADKDASRVAGLIRTCAQKIGMIWLTQDNHQVMDIAHPLFWKDREGNHPAPFTVIHFRAVERGEWLPWTEREKVSDYLRKLEAGGEYAHTVWPEHCIWGSEGAAIVPIVMESVKDWAGQGKYFRVISKGLYPFTEHFGVFRANVPDADVPETELQQALIDELDRYDSIWIVGETASHCVANSVRQLLGFPQIVRKLVIVTDCMSPVAGYEALAVPVFKKAAAGGAHFHTAATLLSEF